MPTTTPHVPSAARAPRVARHRETEREALVALARVQLVGDPAERTMAETPRKERASRPVGRSPQQSPWRWSDLLLALGLLGTMIGVWATWRLPLSAAVLTVPFIGEAVLLRVDRRTGGLRQMWQPVHARVAAWSRGRGGHQSLPGRMTGGQ